MVEFFTFTEASRGPPEASWRSGLWTAVRRLSTPDLKQSEECEGELLEGAPRHRLLDLGGGGQNARAV